MSTPQNNVIINKEAVERMMAGIKVATVAIRPTYGAKGINATIESEFYPFHMVSNDAQTIVQATHVDGKGEKIGLGFLKELMDKQDKDSKDGRKTTCIIAEEILMGGNESDMNKVDLKNELDALIPFVESKIDDVKHDIKPEEVHRIATISSKSEKTGSIIGEIYTKIGKDGIIDIEGSGTKDTYYTITEGVKFQGAGMLSPWFVHDESLEKEGKKPTNAVYTNPVVMVTKRKISHVNDINPLLKSMAMSNKKDLVIFTDDMDSGVATMLVQAHKDRVFNILIIKAPTMWKQYAFEDFAKVTGSTIIEDASGVTFKNMGLHHLGTCEKITTDENETIIVGGADISDHIEKLKSKGDNDSLLRLSWLANKTAVLRLGSNNESELSRIRLGAEDAKNASRLALAGGVITGGGVTLVEISKLLPNSIAGNILKKALTEPYNQMCINSSKTSEKHLEDTIKGAIIDSAIVTKNAVRNAIGLASTVLTSGIVISLPDKTPDQIAQDMMKQKGLRM